MNARFIFHTNLLTLGLLLLGGCSGEAALTAQTETVIADQPASLVGPVAAPNGWKISQPPRLQGHTTYRKGMSITELEPIYLTPTKSKSFVAR